MAQGMRTAWDLMVMPRSRSMSMRSRYWARMSRGWTTPVAWSMRSARVDLPWSMCAMMQKLRSRACSVAAGWTLVICSGVGIGDTEIGSWLFLISGMGLAQVSHDGGPPPQPAGPTHSVRCGHAPVPHASRGHRRKHGHRRARHRAPTDLG